MENERGMVHIYTGNGKGKTTAAMGLALRCAGQGFKVKIVQFMKSEAMFNTYGEVKFMKRCPEIELFQFGTDNWVDPKAPAAADVEKAGEAVEKACAILRDGAVDLLILDEILYALKFNLIGRGQVEKILELGRGNTEIVMTGRDAPDYLIARADLVTEMKEIKHYFSGDKRKATRGIEY